MTRDTDPAVLFATAEFGPWIKVGGLGEASSGLVKSLEAMGAEMSVVMPDFGLIELDETSRFRLDGLPAWCPEVTIRRGWLPDPAEPHHQNRTAVTLVDFLGGHRAHPYTDPATGTGWPDSTWFFLTFSTAVGVLAARECPDVLHLNDWHTASALLQAPAAVPTAFTVHNLAYQGADNLDWLQQAALGGDLTVERRDVAEAFRHHDHFNPLAGAVSVADRVIMVSESYCDEARREDGGFGLHQRLVARGDELAGIRNGIDLGLWSPADDVYLPANFTSGDLTGKAVCRSSLLRTVGLADDRGPVIGMVARLAHQKGIDLALEMVPYLESLPARMVLIGSGSPSLADRARDVAERHPGRFVFCDYNDALAHLVVAGSDLLLMPSRFEPCGLTQLQAMTCGSIPVVTAVGGLRDTVVDTDDLPRRGTGFVADDPTVPSVLDALHRACRGWGNPRRRFAVQRRGMTADWSWTKPARGYLDIYRGLARRPLPDRTPVAPGQDAAWILAPGSGPDVDLVSSRPGLVGSH
ncbi:MAG: glycogen synthase [Acidimicrobiales bacterium]